MLHIDLLGITLNQVKNNMPDMRVFLLVISITLYYYIWLVYTHVLAILISITITVATPSMTRLLDSAPYNNLSLTCTSRMTVKSDPIPFKATITWITSVNGGPMRHISSPFGFIGYDSMVTNTISITVNEVGIHSYICKVTLDLSPASDYISEERNIEVPVYGMFTHSVHVKL